VFKERRGNSYKIISFSAKRARGLMCRYIIDNRITDPEGIRNFDQDDYCFNPDLSLENQWVFTR